MIVKLNGVKLVSDQYITGEALRVPDKEVFQEWNTIDIHISSEFHNTVQSLIEQYIDCIGKMFKSEYPEGKLTALNLHFCKLPFDGVIEPKYLPNDYYFSDPFVQFCDWLESGGFNAVYVDHIPERYSDIAEHGINFVFGKEGS